MSDLPPPVQPVPPAEPGQPDLAAELRKAKRPVNKLTMGLAGAVLIGGAFFGGIATHAAVADEPQPTANPNRPGLGRFGGQGGNGQGQLARGTAGTIDRIEGSTIYVKTPDGREVKVSTSDSTQVRISQEGKLSDLEKGDTIIVQGQAGGDGTVTADQINEQPLRTTG
ncbi:MAG TPA: hypothetical protein VGX25_08865 [Actinophytocola sp.]|uniref:DUF5666 domain-containing protein n=1 Tax=Actinophytocola sp. TaxID=1872138 RepID=UPI002DDC9CF4|nr:hypothetical protein [Actinophytocola sp.]HEV2779499.1 hypothetical protein [Actinophytocola sp.]